MEIATHSGWQILTETPGRTVVPTSAAKFTSFKDAKKALDKAVAENPHRRLVGLIQPINGG